MNIRLEVFELSHGWEGLAQNVVEGIARSPGYGPGVEVIPLRIAPPIKKDTYRVEVHRGDITDEHGLVRIVGNQIWTQNISELIETSLRQKKIGFTFGVFIDKYSASVKRTREYQFNGNIETTYTPVEPLDLTKK